MTAKPTCPTCGKAKDRAREYAYGMGWHNPICPDPFHAAPAPEQIDPNQHAPTVRWPVRVQTDPDQPRNTVTLRGQSDSVDITVAPEPERAGETGEYQIVGIDLATGKDRSGYFVPDTPVDAERALREAHEMAELIVENVTDPTLMHHAINRLARAAFEAGKREVDRHDSATEPDWLPKEPR